MSGRAGDARPGGRPPAPLALPDGTPALDAWTLDPGMVHVNHGSYGAVPRVAQQRQRELLHRMEAAPGRWFARLPSLVADVRHAVARYLHCSAEHTALVPNASGGASVVFGCLAVPAGSEIVVTDHGYGAVTMGAERLARRCGARVRTVHVPLSATAERARRSVGAALSPTTSLLVLDQITSSTARRLPVSELSDDARAMGVTTLVDGAHAPGLLPRPLDGLRCDAWIGNLHKFGCAPHGSAALVAPGPIREHLFPLIDSWGAPEPFPARFDTQGTIDATSMLAAPAALEFIESTWGWDRVRRYLTELADYAETRIAGAFEDITGELHSVDVGMPVNALRLVRLPDGLAPDLVAANELRDRIAAELRAEVAVTSFGGQGYLRLSAHVYNTAAHYDYVADVCVPALCRWAKEVSERRPPAGRSPEPDD